MEEPPWGKVLLLIYFVSSKPNKITRQLCPSRRILPHLGRYSGPTSWGPSQPLVQPSCSVPPFRDVHIMCLLSGLKTIVCFPGTGSPARSQPCIRPSYRIYLFRFLNASSRSVCTRLHRLLLPGCSQPTTPTFIFWSVPTKRPEARGAKP